MAKRKLCISLLLSTALAGTGYGVFQDTKVAQLEKRVKLLDDRLAKVEKYVRAQASSISAFGASLESAVKKGYTAGINYESRQVLVGLDFCPYERPLWVKADVEPRQTNIRLTECVYHVSLSCTNRRFIPAANCAIF